MWVSTNRFEQATTSKDFVNFHFPGWGSLRDGVQRSTLDMWLRSATLGLTALR